MKLIISKKKIQRQLQELFLRRRISGSCGYYIGQIHKINTDCKTPVLGITGTGGAGKSSLVDELVRRFLIDFPKKTIGIISVDPLNAKQAARYWVTGFV